MEYTPRATTNSTQSPDISQSLSMKKMTSQDQRYRAGETKAQLRYGTISYFLLLYGAHDFDGCGFFLLMMHEHQSFHHR
jgi:hypothetical protein